MLKNLLLYNGNSGVPSGWKNDTVNGGNDIFVGVSIFVAQIRVSKSAPVNHSPLNFAPFPDVENFTVESIGAWSRNWSEIIKAAGRKSFETSIELVAPKIIRLLYDRPYRIGFQGSDGLTQTRYRKRYPNYIFIYLWYNLVLLRQILIDIWEAKTTKNLRNIIAIFCVTGLTPWVLNEIGLSSEASQSAHSIGNSMLMTLFLYVLDWMLPSLCNIMRYTTF